MLWCCQTCDKMSVNFHENHEKPACETTEDGRENEQAGEKDKLKRG